MSRLINIQFRRGESSQWIETNPILSSGELGFELDTNQFKIGNGISDWLSLPYQSINKYLLKKQTLDDSEDVILTVDGNNSFNNAEGTNLIIVPSQTTWLFTINLSAYNLTDHTRAAFSFRGAVGRNNNNQTSLIGNVISESFLDENMMDVKSKIEADAIDNSLKIKVTGLSNKTINWNASIIINEVSEA
jgi:hypothetical protein